MYITSQTAFTQSYSHRILLLPYKALLFCWTLIVLSCVLCATSDDISQNKPNYDIILIGPGISSPRLVFPSRYFFVLHRVPISTVVIKAKPYNSPIDEQHQASQCRIWSQTFNETHFCVRLNQTAPSSVTHSFSDLLDDAAYCDDDDDALLGNDTSAFKLIIVRYKLYSQSQCNTPLEVIIRDHQGLVIQQRTIINGDEPLYSDQCDCPDSKWHQLMQCDKSAANVRLSKQIELDLKPFANGIDFDSVLAQSIDRFAAFPRTYAFCLYQVISNRLYRNCFGEYVGFARFFDEFLLSLTRKAILPDTELLVNLGDWPLSERNTKPQRQQPQQQPQPIPMFSWCGSTDSHDIVLPTYELTESILHAQGRVSTTVLSTFGQQSLPFEKKEAKLFWRGRDSNRVRLDLIKQARSNPSLYNVSITNFFFFRDEMADYMDNSTLLNNTNPNARAHIPYVPFLQFFSNRYQINIDGTVAAYRFPFLLAGNSLVIKQDSKYYEFFYHLLQSGLHYLPTKADISDLPATLDRLTNTSNPQYNPTQAKHIIWNARKLVLSHLLPEHVYCYYYNAISLYTKLLNRKEIRLRANMTLVTLEDQSHSTGQPFQENTQRCSCDESRGNGDRSSKEEL